MRREAHTGKRVRISPVIEDSYRRRFDEVRRDTQQDFTFAPRLLDKREIPFDKISQAAVDELGCSAARAVGEVALLDQPDSETAV